MLAVSLTVAISSMACGGKTEEQRGEDAVEAFTDEVVDALEQIELAHGSLFDPEISALPASQQEARYSTHAEDMRRERERLGAMEVPDDLTEAQQRFTAVLAQEREMWIHLVLFTRTGQELHRVLANEILVNNQQETQVAVGLLLGDLREMGIDTADTGLEAFVVVGTPVPSVVRPTPTASATVSPPVSSPTMAPTLTAGPEPTTLPTQEPTLTPAPTGKPTVTSGPSPPPTPTAFAATLTPPSITQPTDTPVPTPTLPSTPVALLTPSPSPTPIPILTEGNLVVIKFPDSRGNPAFIAHWIVHVEPGALMVIEYPFVADDRLEVSSFMGFPGPGITLKQTYIESPDGQRLVELKDFSRSWRGEIITRLNGTYRVYFDNTGGDASREMHLLITYHTSALGSQAPS